MQGCSNGVWGENWYTLGPLMLDLKTHPKLYFSGNHSESDLFIDFVGVTLVCQI